VDRVLPDPSPSANLVGFWRDVTWMIMEALISVAGT